MGGPVAHAGRHADHRCPGEPADEARERAVHTGHDDHAVRPLEVGQHAGEAVDACDTDVLVHDDLRPEQLRPDAGLPHHGPVGRPGRDHEHQPAALGEPARDPDAPRQRVLLGPRRDLAHRRAYLLVRPGDEHAARSALDERLHDACHLLRSLPLREHGLRGALSQLAVEVDAGEAEVAEREGAEALERVLGRGAPRADVVEERAQIVAKARHAAIVR